MSTEAANPGLRKRNPWPPISAIALLLVLGSLSLAAVESSRKAALRHDCVNNLKQIGIALLNRESAYKRLQPAFVADADGKPMHSWRVMILPYLQSPNFYHRYGQNEPWDSPLNSQFAKEIPEPYRCPADTGPATDTSYVAIVGPGTGWPGATGLTIREMTDGLAKTIAVVEVINSGINWMEPRDITLDEAIQGLDRDGPGLKLASNHTGGFNVLFFDVHVTFLKESLDAETLRALLTAAGGEQVPDFPSE